MRARQEDLCCRYTASSFTVAGVRLEGSLACLRDSHFLWSAATIGDLHRGALCLHSLVRPQPGATAFCSAVQHSNKAMSHAIAVQTS